jgi:formate/nitrite transporter
MAAEGAVGQTALNIAQSKAVLPFGRAVVLGILCNVLVCLAVWLSFSARTTADRILSVFPPITAFVAMGFEHSVANMYFIPVGLMIKGDAPPAFWQAIGRTASEYPDLSLYNFLVVNLLPVTLGNMIGGVILVGLVYWFVYLRGGIPEAVKGEAQ